MNYDLYKRIIRDIYPIIISVFATAFNFVALLIDIVSQEYFLKEGFYLAFIASSVLSVVLVSVFMVKYVRKRFRESIERDFSIIESEDVFIINDLAGEDSLHTRTVTARANKDSDVPIFVTFSNPNSGRNASIRAYDTLTSTEFDVTPRHGTSMLLIDVKQRIKKGQVIANLCIEWRDTQAFVGEYESVSIFSEAEQTKAILRVRFPQGVKPKSVDLFATRNQRDYPTYHHQPALVTDKDGYTWISFDFCEYLQQVGEGLVCTIGWRWTPTKMEITANEVS